MAAVFECIPNIAEGRDAAIIDACAAAIVAGGLRLAHRTSDPVHHRTVFTFFGARDRIIDAAVALARVTTERIDLRAHRGVHPRIGALDVLPFVPFGDATLDDAAELAHAVAARIWHELGVPSLFYGAASRHAPPRTLPEIRRGEFARLGERQARGERPDVGEALFHPSAGTIAVGARPVLIAFNIELASGDLALARAIAHKIRARDGGIATLRALGLRISNNRVQVTCNLTDVDAVPLGRLVALVRRLAARAGVAVADTELIGLVPRRALQAVLDERLQ
ncbi:MAG: glutamate formimidoyltransferase [Vulcanimicrobiaceae bacterium]